MNNLAELRTGTADDGRALFRVGPAGPRQDSRMRDLRSRIPRGWSIEIYEASGIDAVLTHVGIRD